MNKRTVNAGLKVRLQLEQLEGRLAPAAHAPEHLATDLNPAAIMAPIADTRVIEIGPMDHVAIRPLLAAVAAIGICAAWDHRAKRLNRRGHPAAK
jgi:hypothetical protein